MEEAIVNKSRAHQAASAMALGAANGWMVMMRVVVEEARFFALALVEAPSGRELLGSSVHPANQRLAISSPRPRNSLIKCTRCACNPQET